MSLKFLADADFNRAIVKGVRRREPAIDLLHADEAGIRAMPDPLVLDLCARQGRVLVSHDMSTLPNHFLQYLREGKRSPGVLLAGQEAPVKDIIEAVLLVWLLASPEDIENQILYLPGLSRHVFSANH